mmetsp:Transcript_13159/g.26290  ORF Transcript_13159/g.26290 Transcript_13159/m.26290 type:complete len:280 (-) Transcript_13159:591-1430(-)
MITGSSYAQPNVESHACMVIQRAFRRFINTRIYRYYRDLVNFRHRGDPGLLLRCINPQEAALVHDRASGAVVRFRLGGTVFPPVVYYKVFLRNAVTDIGSFAPRDYTVGKPNQFYLLGKHNDGACVDDHRAENVRDVTAEVDRRLWYHRFENNGWRPIANKHLHTRDFVALTTAQKRIPDFHHLTKNRRQNATLKREKNKERWMQRMYKPEGQQTKQATIREGEEEDGDEDESQGGGREIDPEEEADIEQWVQGLDFEEYFSDWISLATSMTTMQLGAT